MQVVDEQIVLDLSSATLDLYGNFFPYLAIERRGKWNEFSDEFSIDAHQDIARFQPSRGR